MSIVLHNHDFAREQCVAAAFEPLGEPTDWDLVIRNAGDIDVDSLTGELKAGQPYESNDENKLKCFRLQTKIRIGHRHRRGLPQYADTVCGDCGVRRADPVLNTRSWRAAGSGCIYCEEVEYLVPDHESRMDDTKVSVRFDSITGSWGIAFSIRENREESGAIIVHGFPTYHDARVANAAPARFVELFNRVCPVGSRIYLSQIRNHEALFASKLPMNPDQWRAFLEKNMRAVETYEDEPYAGAVREAAREYFREKHG